MQTTVIAVKATLHRIASVGTVISAGSRYVPFAAHVGGVAAGTHDLGNRGIFGINLTAVTRTVFVHLGHPSHAHLMLVSSGKQGRTAGTAAAGILELTEPDSIVSQTVNIRSMDFAAIAAQIRKSHIITQNQYDIGSLCISCHQLSGCGQLVVRSSLFIKYNVNKGKVKRLYSILIVSKKLAKNGRR